jgi:chromosome segregation ATPase
MTTDTPRTDAISDSKGMFQCSCSRDFKDLSRQLERELDESKAEVKRLRDAFERLKEQYEFAAESVARMHEAAVGEIRGPIISVIEDIKAVRERAEKAEADVERMRTALQSCYWATNTYDGDYTRACDNVATIAIRALKTQDL